MISIISPAKSMNFELPAPSEISSDLEVRVKNLSILKELQECSAQSIAKLMKVSEKISMLNYERFQNYDNNCEKQAIFAYAGDVYNSIDTINFTGKNLEFAQEHLMIISAFYGLLRPLDKIKAYRLEMVTKLTKLAPKGLAKFWQQEVTDAINVKLGQQKSRVLLNIASNEYSAAIDQKSLKSPMINVHFREMRNGALKNIALNSKRARGMMADYIIRNGIDEPEEVKSFNKGEYSFDAKMSDEYNLFFVRCL